MPLANIGTLIEVTPAAELQHWPDAHSEWYFVNDTTPFYFRVAGELTDHAFFFGLHGPVESGPQRYLDLICSVLIRYDDSDWHSASSCTCSFKVAPTIAKRTPGYDASEHADCPFHIHPEGTFVEGFPRTSRLADIRGVEERSIAR